MAGKSFYEYRIADLKGRLCVVEAIIKYQPFCLIGVYAPIDSRDQAAS